MGGEYDGTQNISVANSLFLSHPCSLSGDSQVFGPRESRGNRAPGWARAWWGEGEGEPLGRLIFPVLSLGTERAGRWRLHRAL